jgi:hypothetical protein
LTVVSKVGRSVQMRLRIHETNRARKQSPTEMSCSVAAELVSSCSEKERLLRALHVATLNYRRAALVLQERLGVMKKEHYRRIRAYVDEARAKVEEARQAVQRHAAEHGC